MSIRIKIFRRLIFCLPIVLLWACTSPEKPTTTPQPQPIEEPIATEAPTIEIPDASTNIPPPVTTEASTDTPNDNQAGDPTSQTPEITTDLLQGTWEEQTSMPTARSEMPAVELNGLIYVTGGFGGEQTLEAYDLANDSWQALADLPAQRHHVMAAAHDDRLFVFGGAQGPSWPLNAIM
jgi:hypothetical protein